MAYLALARKWRPKSFSEVVGQEHVVKALSNALNAQKVHHALLFTGTRGVGKTSLARIFAKSLNCEKGMSAQPCQQCSTCVAVDEGRYVDLIEVDAASRTRVDDTRELLENVQYAPTAGRYKVYLIDEVHMLSGHSFNALLKTLEEPPEHVKFLFATTDPQKLPITVVSRCLQFSLRAMRPEQVENQLVSILGKEQLPFDPPALRLLAKAADGSMRDGLSLLDQAIAQGDGEVRESDVRQMLGSIQSSHIVELLNALVAQDLDAALEVSKAMQLASVDYADALDELMVAIYNIALMQTTKQILDSDDAIIAAVEHAANGLSPDEVQLFYQIGLHAKRDIKWAPSSQVGFDIALLRMFSFTPTGPQHLINEPSTANQASKQTQEAEHKEPSATKEPSANDNREPSATHKEPSANNNREPSANKEPVPQQEPTPSSSRPPETAMQPETVNEQIIGNEAAQSAQTASHLSSSNAQPSPVTQASEGSIVAVQLAGNNEWGELVEQSSLQGMSKELAMHSACEKLGEDEISLSLAPKNKHIYLDARFAEIEAAMSALFNRTMIVKIEFEDSDRETPAECLARLGVQQIEQTKESLQQEPGLQAVMSEFGASIDDSSIEPYTPDQHKPDKS